MMMMIMMMVRNPIRIIRIIRIKRKRIPGIVKKKRKNKLAKKHWT